MSRTLLFDADSFAYSVACMVETPIHWGDDLWTLHSDAKEAKLQLDNTIKRVVDLIDGTNSLFFLTDGDNFRKAVLPTYKMKRKETRKPTILGELREYLIEKYGAVRWESLEADDVVGIHSTSPTLVKGERVIVSIDKDMKTIPGLVFNPNNADVGIIKITEEQADLYHMTQTLTGDPTDGYSGCPGVGAVKAAKILNVPRADRWNAVLQAFKDAELGEEEALRQARVARILRAGEYDKKTGKVKLWTPQMIQQ